MELNEKRQLADSILKGMNVEYSDFKISRLDGMNADHFIPDFDLRKTGIVIDDEGRYVITDNDHPSPLAYAELIRRQREEVDENKENKRFIRTIQDRNFFIFEYHRGDIMSEQDCMILEEIMNKQKITTILDNEYKHLKDGTFEIIKKHVIDNIDRLVKMALESITDMKEGGFDYITIKYKTLYFQVDSMVLKSEDQEFYNTFINDIKEIIKSNSESMDDLNKKMHEQITDLVKDIDEKIAVLEKQELEEIFDDKN